MSAVESTIEIEGTAGRVAGVVGSVVEVDITSGYSRYRDPVTRELGLLASTWDSIHKQWQATHLRAQHGSPQLEKVLGGYADALKLVRERVGRRMTATTKQHPLWPWLESHPGVRGVHVVRLISMIGDPLRFPGRKCVIGHHSPSDWEGPCSTPVKDEQHHLGDDGEWVVCGMDVGSVRRGTGVRSLWHYCGLHVVDGKLARKRKGVQCTWNPAARTALLQPDGIADQIIRQRTEPWRTKYDETKERVSRERGAEVVAGIDGSSGLTPSSKFEERGAEPSCEIEQDDSPSLHDDVEGDAEFRAEIEYPVGVAGSGDGTEAELDTEIEVSTGLRPFQVHKIARTVAVKAFVGDLLMAWKEAVG